MDVQARGASYPNKMESNDDNNVTYTYIYICVIYICYCESNGVNHLQRTFVASVAGMASVRLWMG